MRGSNGWTQDNNGMPMQGGGNSGNPFSGNTQGNVNNGYQSQVNNQNMNTNSSYQQSEPEAQILTREMYTDPYRNSMPQQGSVRQPRVNNGGNQQRPQGNVGGNQQNANMQNRSVQGNYPQRNVQTGGVGNGNQQRPTQNRNYQGNQDYQDSSANKSKTGLCVLLSVICTLLAIIVILVVMSKFGYVQFGKEVKVPEKSTESRVDEDWEMTSEYSWNTTESTPSTEFTETDTESSTIVTESSTIVTETTTTAPTEENKTEESSESNNSSSMGNVGTGTITLPDGFTYSQVDVGSNDIVCYSASDESGNNSITLMSIANDNIKTYTDGVVKQMESYTDKEIIKSSGKCGSYDATVVSSYLTQYKKYMKVYIFTTDKDEYIHYVAIESPQKDSSDGSWSILSLEDYVNTYK